MLTRAVKSERRPWMVWLATPESARVCFQEERSGNDPRSGRCSAHRHRNWLLILCFCSSVSFQQGHLRESCWKRFLLMNLAAIHLHFFKRQMFHFSQTKLHSQMPRGNKFQICPAQQHLPNTFWMEVPFSTEFCGLVVRNLMQSVVSMFSMCGTSIDLLS